MKGGLQLEHQYAWPTPTFGLASSKGWQVTHIVLPAVIRDIWVPTPANLFYFGLPPKGEGTIKLVHAFLENDPIVDPDLEKVPL